MSLAVVAPVLNEIFFLDYWYTSVAQYADQIILSDGGSTDGTLEWLYKMDRIDERIVLLHHTQEGLPYTVGWKENEVRNRLLESVTCEWTLCLDIDEMLHDSFRERKLELTTADFDGIYGFQMIAFWKNLHTQRINHPRDRRWNVPLHRMWRTRMGLRYSSEAHHCYLLYAGQPAWQLPLKTVRGCPVFHLHYGCGPRIKFNDNRRGDVGRLENVEEPDWSRYEKRDEHYAIVTVPYEGPWPEPLIDLVEESACARQ